MPIQSYETFYPGGQAIQPRESGAPSGPIQSLASMLSNSSGMPSIFQGRFPESRP